LSRLRGLCGLRLLGLCGLCGLRLFLLRSRLLRLGRLPSLRRRRLCLCS
jgi:hypothetical protein